MVQTDDKTLDQLNEEADIAADYLEGLLDIADYEGDIEMGVRCSSSPALLCSRRPANVRT